MKRSHEARFAPTWHTLIFQRYQDTIDDLLSSCGAEFHETLDSESFERFKNIYGSLPFACRFRDCPRALDGFIILAERERHEKVHYRRWRCADLECPFYSRGWESARALVRHNQEYHLMRQAFHDEEGNPSPLITSGGREEEVDRIDRDVPLAGTEFLCRGTLKSGDIWGCGEVFNSASALKAHYRTTVGFGCIGKLYIETACVVDQDDLQPGKRKYLFSNECLGTLDSGAQWGCGKDFGTQEYLYKHWQSESGRECRQSVYDEVETKINRVQGLEPNEKIQTDRQTPLMSFLAAPTPALQNLQAQRERGDGKRTKSPQVPDPAYEGVGKEKTLSLADAISRRVSLLPNDSVSPNPEDNFSRALKVRPPILKLDL